MKTLTNILLPTLIWLAIAAAFGCKEKSNDTIPSENCGYTINIAESNNTIVTYNNNCANSNIGQSATELIMVLSSSDTKYALTINAKGTGKGDYIVKNETPFGAGTVSIFLTSDQSKIPGSLSFSTGKLTVTRLENQLADGTINATAFSAINKKTYTLSGEFKNMPVKKILN